MSLKMIKTCSEQQGDYHPQKIKWKPEFLSFLSVFQEYEEQKLNTT